jgi:hypothetical protein
MRFFLNPSHNAPSTEDRSVYYAIIVVTALVLFVIGVQTLLRTDSEWQQVYVAAGAHWLAGDDFYTSGSYAYPPFMAMAAAPLSAVPEWLSRIIWLVLSSIAFLVTVKVAWRLANGAPLSHPSSSLLRERLAFFAGLAISLGFIFNAFAHQQTDVLIAGLLLGGALAIRNKHGMIGGAAIGLAAGCKASPLLWAPYLFWRGRRGAAAMVVAAALSINALPDLFVAAPHGTWWMQRWVEDFVWPSQRPGAAVGLWATNIEYNQSLAGTLQRWINTELAFSPSPHVVVRTLVDAITLKIVLYSMFVILVLVSIMAARARPNPEVSSHLPDREEFEFCIVLILMLMLSPMSGRAHFGILILPAFCLARFALWTGHRVILAIVVTVIVLVGIAHRDLVPEAVHAAFLWAGATTASAILLWLGCVVALWSKLDRLSAQPVAHEFV